MVCQDLRLLFANFRLETEPSQTNGHLPVGPSASTGRRALAGDAEGGGGGAGGGGLAAALPVVDRQRIGATGLSGGSRRYS